MVFGLIQTALDRKANQPLVKLRVKFRVRQVKLLLSVDPNSQSEPIDPHIDENAASLPAHHCQLNGL